MATALRLGRWVFTDKRFDVLGALYGKDKYDARGRVFELWDDCTSKGQYQWNADDIDSLVRVQGFSKHLLTAQLARPSGDMVEIIMESPKARRAPRVEGTQAFIAIYSELFKRTYKTNPPITKEDLGMAKSLVQNLGIGTCRDLLEAYFRIQDRWFIQKRHDLWTFKSNIKPIAVTAGTGSRVSQEQARDLDHKDQNIQAVRDYLASKEKENNDA